MTETTRVATPKKQTVTETVGSLGNNPGQEECQKWRYFSSLGTNPGPRGPWVAVMGLLFGLCLGASVSTYSGLNRAGLVAAALIEVNS